MAKAIASGDPRLMQKAGLEADIARLERLRSAHQDDQFAIRRQIRDAERDIEYSTRRIGEIGQDLARLVPTTGDAFRMSVGKETFIERKLAGRGLMTEILTLVQLQNTGTRTIAAIGGFDLRYSGERFGQDGYRYATMLVRTGAETEIELPSMSLLASRRSRSDIGIASLTPSGAWRPIARARAVPLPFRTSWPASAGSLPRSRTPCRRTWSAPGRPTYRRREPP